MGNWGSALIQGTWMLPSKDLITLCLLLKMHLPSWLVQSTSPSLMQVWATGSWKLDDKSSYLTTFDTIFGRYCVRRLPLGLISAQDEFQRKMDEVFDGLPGITPLVDDVLISGRTRQEHDRKLQAALERSSTKNLKLNPEKHVVGASEVQYFGHTISSEGLKPDPAKVKAAQDMSPPINKKKNSRTCLAW